MPEMDPQRLSVVHELRSPGFRKQSFWAYGDANVLGETLQDAELLLREFDLGFAEEDSVANAIYVEIPDFGHRDFRAFRFD